MPRGKRFTDGQIIGKFRDSEVGLAREETVAEVTRKLGVIEQTCYRWKRKCGGLRTDQAKWLMDLEKENARLKRLLADAEPDKAIFREAASGNFRARRRGVRWSSMRVTCSAVAWRPNAGHAGPAAAAWPRAARAPSRSRA